MTNDRDWGQQRPPQYQQPWEQGEQGGPWQRQRYDPAAHHRRMQAPQQEPPWQQQGNGQQYPPQGQPWQQPGPREQSSWQEPGRYQHPQPQHRKRSRGPLIAGIAAAVVIVAGGGTAYALTSHHAKPLTCAQQYQAWKTGPAHGAAQQLKTDLTAVQSAGNSEDIPQMTSALKAIGSDATTMKQYPMPACADPAGYWPQVLAELQASGDNAGVSSGLGGLILAEAPLKQVPAVEEKLSTELARTAGVKA